MQTVLGKYEIRATIAAGPMSTVYEGWDTAIERRVAIKAVPLAQTVQSDNWQHLARFRREAQAAGRLQHPTVVGIFDYGESPEFAFIIMEFVDGGTLKSALEEGRRFSVGAIDRLMQDILAGLQYSHEQGVIHRDIKPANIMLTRDGHAKIADFGIARIEHSDITQIGMVLGTPAYMSPEQFRGETTSASTDISSAGIILYQLLTGERPFDGGLATIMHKVLGADPPKPSDISGTVPHSADAVVARAMAKRPDQRFRDARQFAHALHAALTIEAAKPAAWSLRALAGWLPARRAAAPPNRHLLVGALLAALVAAGGTAAFWMSRSHPAANSGKRAQELAGSPPIRTSPQTAPATPQAPKQASQDSTVDVQPASAPEKPGIPQSSPLDLTSTQPAAPTQPPSAETGAPLIAPALPVPDLLAPALQPPAAPRYPPSVGSLNAPRLPQPLHRDPRSQPSRPGMRQTPEPGTDDAPPPPVAALPNQPGGQRAERRPKDAGPVPDPAKPAARDNAVPPSTVPFPSIPGSTEIAPAPKPYGTMDVFNGRRFFVPAPGSDR